MKSLLLLWSKLAEESASWCCTSATLDIKTVQRRFEHEGLSFLTIALPEFGKDTQKCLDQGRVDRDSFTGFRFRAGLPLFLGGFLDRVFDRTSGRLLDDPCVDAILAVRQLTLLFGKISLPCSDVRVRKSIREFVECEREVRIRENQLGSEERADFNRISLLLYAGSLTKVDRKINHFGIVPKHGPGSTADKLLGNQKFGLRSWPRRLETVFPVGDFLLPNHRYYDELDDVHLPEPGQEQPVRVVTVPKTLKTPRIIAIEPTAMQYAQQGLLEAIREALDEDDYLAHLIGFDDQTPNQQMAAKGSLTGDLATLDLSEASDRVSNQLVRQLFSRWRSLHDAIDASRSRKADVPDHGVLRLAKFASMGSALTFPVEAMVFLTIILYGIERDLNRPLVRSDIKHLVGRVRVYGDDIVVPVEHVRSVVSALETFGFLVNGAKSFWTGRFRESCGKEYYAGHDVSVVKVRNVFPTHRMDATGVISMISLRNQLYFSGYWKTCQWLDDKIRDVIRYFPVVLPSSPVQGRHSFLGFETQKQDEHLHRPLVRGYVVSARIPHNPVRDSGALLKWFLKRGEQPFADRNHLERSGRPQRVDIKLRWASPV